MRFARKIIATMLLGLGWPSIVLAATATLTWEAPTHNTDGSDLTDLAGYNLYWGCLESGAYDDAVSVDDPAVTSHTLEALPDDGVCYFAVTAFNDAGTESELSNEVSQDFGPLPPGAVTNLRIEWREVDRAFGDYIGGEFARGTGTSASVTHGLTINEGNLVVAYVNSNATDAISDDAGGAAWNNPVNETPTDETGRHAGFWKVASASEPSSYSFTVGDAGWQVIVKVFDGGDGVSVDAAAVSDMTETSTSTIVASAIDGQVVSDNALSIVMGGKDNRREGTELYTTADNSYTGVEGDAGTQATAMAHRLYTTGETFSGPVTFETTDRFDGANDVTYSIHMSFVESGGGG